MTVDLEGLEELKQRLVLRHKPGGRCVYDKATKAEFVELCVKSGVSVSRLAREAGVNANQVSRWIREHGQQRKRISMAPVVPPASPFVTVPLPKAPPKQSGCEVEGVNDLRLQARLPNGVTLDLRGMGLGHLAEVIQMLGRVTCSISTSI